MSGTKIIQTWALDNGAITLNLHATQPLHPETISKLTPIIEAIEEWVGWQVPTQGVSVITKQLLDLASLWEEVTAAETDNYAESQAFQACARQLRKTLQAEGST